MKSYADANHPPVVKLAHALDMKVRPGDKVSLSASGTTDPDGDALTYRWWQYRDPSSYDGNVEIERAGHPDASFLVPADAKPGQTIHVICEVTDGGTPPLTRYQRVVLSNESVLERFIAESRSTASLREDPRAENVTRLTEMYGMERKEVAKAFRQAAGHGLEAKRAARA